MGVPATARARDKVRHAYLRLFPPTGGLIAGELWRRFDWRKRQKPPYR